MTRRTNRAAHPYLLLLAILLVTSCATQSQPPAPPQKSSITTAPGEGVPPLFGEMTELAGHRTDKGSNGHHFTELYEHIFFPLKDDPIRILEIGIAEGGSLALWQDYFPRARIDGIDIADRSHLNNERVSTFIADQARREQLAQVIEVSGGEYAFILDDGGHAMTQQQISFGFLFRYVRPGGYYVIEDVHTSLPFRWSGFGVNEDESNSTLTMILQYIRTRKLDSRYLTPQENQYLTEHVEYCLLFFRNTGDHSMTAVFKKKAN